MRVVFVYRTKSLSREASPIIRRQKESLIDHGIEVDCFPILGKSFIVYFKSILIFRKFLNQKKIDIIHAHYSLCGITAVLAFPRIPIVLSLMGSDVLGEYISVNKVTFKSKTTVAITFVLQFFVNVIIVKSQNLYSHLYRKKISRITPNGVNLEHFVQMDKIKMREELNLDKEKKYVLNLSNPEHYWKNLSLAKDVLESLGDDNLVLLTPFPVEQDIIPKYLNAADVLLITSYMEGSCNIIKEAMACNCPIVATDVGDAKWVIGDTEGCFITTFELNDIAGKVMKALKFVETRGHTNGRNKIIHLGLDAKSIANKIIDIYKKLI